MQTITALFDRYEDAQQAVRKLEAAGVPHSEISIVSNDANQRSRYDTTSGTARTGATRDDEVDGTAAGATTGALIGGGAGLLAGLGLMAIPGLGPVVAAGWLVSTLVGAGAGAAVGGLAGSLIDAGVDENDAEAYAEGVRRGGTLVTVRAQDNMVERAVDILDDEGTVDIDERQTAWRREGWTGGTATPTAERSAGTTGTGGAVGTSDRTSGALKTAATGSRSGTSTGREEAIPIVEEELKVGKREVNRGKVRIHSHVVETPVREEVNLREEHVRVERRQADRPASGTDDAFRERTIEAEERSEEAVVSKDARVKEELVLKKDVDQRTETVSDKVRRTEVDVKDERGKPVGGGKTGGTDRRR